MNLKFVHKTCWLFVGFLQDGTVERKVSALWSHMHLFSSIQLAKILAEKRGLRTDLAVYCVLFHDLATIVRGITDSHAEQGAAMFEDFLTEHYEAEEAVEHLSELDRKVIQQAILHHSEKEITDENPYLEFTKDVDCYDRYLYNLETEGAYLKRVKRVQSELGL